MTTNDISNAAAALGRKGGSARTKAKTEAARSNGAKGGRPFTWHKAPRRGCVNPASQLYKFTVVRLSDMAERFTDRKPRAEIVHSPDFTVWDNKANEEVR